MNPICFLHIGTHKTGTTALQIFLGSNEPCLARNGIFIPRNARPWLGARHHNLAWDLIGDGRFDPAFGSWPEVLSEIRSLNPPTVCLSSEDFGLLQLKPDSLIRIRQELNSIGYEVKIVVYLRPQSDFIESMYAELVKGKRYLVFRTYLAEILLSGAFSLGSPGTITFDYGQILDPFAKVFGINCMVVRPYRANRKSKYLLEDFISVISAGHRIRGLDFSTSRERHNPSLSFARVVEKLLAKQPKHLGEDSELKASSIPKGRFMDGRFDPLDLRDLMDVRHRFRETNQVLREKYQVKIPTVTWRRLLQELECSMGLNPNSSRRKDVFLRLNACGEQPQATVSG